MYSYCNRDIIFFGVLKKHDIVFSLTKTQKIHIKKEGNVYV